MNKVKSFAEFWEEIKKIQCPDDETLVFRGHADKIYKMLPGIFRNPKLDEEQRQYHDIMIECPEEFKQRSHLSNLVKMQHYGVATRLLDFTQNPLVALFFASEKCGSIDKETDGEVIIIRVKKSEILHHYSDRALMLSCLPCFSDNDKSQMKEFCSNHKGRITEQYASSYDNVMHKFLHEIRGEYPGFECEMIGEDLIKGYFVAPFKDNERMKLQNGLFYIFGLDERALDEKLYTERIVIDKNAKDDILDDLEKMNISNSHLYSGLERAAMNNQGRRSNWISKR